MKTWLRSLIAELRPAWMRRDPHETGDGVAPAAAVDKPAPDRAVHHSSGETRTPTP